MRSLICISTWKQRLLSATAQTSSVNDPVTDLLEYWLPLTTASRSEMDRLTVRQRHDQLVDLLSSLGVSMQKEEELIRAIRSNEACRRLATLAMRPFRQSISSTRDSSSSKNNSFMTNVLLDAPDLELPPKLAKIWPKLLLLPIEKEDEKKEKLHDEILYEISMIVPAFREKGSDIVQKLEKARWNAKNPLQIEVIIVDAGKCTELEAHINELRTNKDEGGFGKLRLVTFTLGGGRGPCLNFGAKNACGRILTFCHSDTALPNAWDSKIIFTLFPPVSSSSSSLLSNSCAFSFGIDTSIEGLSSGGGRYPPGIKAVETTANLRTHMYSLPYGDQVLSIPSAIFNYIGGFPDQCLMEDYELVGLLRRRAALLPKFLSHFHSSARQNISLPYPNSEIYPKKEQLAIIGGDPALCSPRRWQKFGVLYVTFMNSKFVNLYAGGLSPDGLFQLYYGGAAPQREHRLSPWEVDLI